MMHENVLEELPIGILILSVRGNLIFANGYAQQLCHEIQEKSEHSTPKIPLIKSLPQPIWRICQAVIESRELFPERPIIIEDFLQLSSTKTVQLRSRWIGLDVDSYILVMLEAQSHQQATVETQQYNLTDREAEVWLLRRSGYPYKAIASQLQITLNTVKKHIKNIHAKRDLAKWLSE